MTGRQHVADLGQQAIGGEWLGQQRLGGVEQAVVDRRRVDVARHVQHAHVRPHAHQLLGQLAPDEAHEFAEFFRCRRTGRIKNIDPVTISMLAEIGLRYPGHVIEIVSGYRASAHESRTSPHRAGRAIDLRVRGVKTTEVRDWLWATHRDVGIGWYPHSNYLHMDHRTNIHDTSWTQYHKDDENSYNPRWARVAREASKG